MWIVLCWDSPATIAATYGPFSDEEQAGRVAEFLSAEVNPATVERLMNPLVELLNWRDAVARTAGPGTSDDTNGGAR